MAPYLAVKNWPRFQHYRNRRPPWIKLYHQLLEDHEFLCLDMATRGLLITLWLLASENNGWIFYERNWLQKRSNCGRLMFRLRKLIENGWLIEFNTIKEIEEYFASILLASCKQSAIPDIEIDIEIEKEKIREEKKEEIPPIPPQGESSGKPKRGRVKPAVETEDEYIAKVNSHFASLRTQNPETKHWEETPTTARWFKTYDRINVDGQVRMARQWLLDNAGDAKKRRTNFNGFIAGWLGRAQTKAEQDGTCYKPAGDDDGYTISPERQAEIWAFEDELARRGEGGYPKTAEPDPVSH